MGKTDVPPMMAEHRIKAGKDNLLSTILGVPCERRVASSGYFQDVGDRRFGADQAFPPARRQYPVALTGR
jgi:hypothetical protein